MVVVNIITGFVMYILFSLRYSRAIKNRDQGIVDSMRTIANETRKSSLDILDLVQQKQESIYLLTRRAEQLLTDLNSIAGQTTRKTDKKKPGVVEENKKIKKKKTRKKTASDKRTIPGKSGIKKSAAQTLKSNTFIKSKGIHLRPKPPSDPDSKQNDVYFERVLAKQNLDQIELQENAESLKEAFDKGRMTSRDDDGIYATIKDVVVVDGDTKESDLKSQSTNLSSRTDPSGLLAVLGRFAKKIMGAADKPRTIIYGNSPDSLSIDARNAQKNSSLKTQNFGKYLEHAAEQKKDPDPSKLQKPKIDLLPKLDRYVPSDVSDHDITENISISDEAKFSPLYNSAPEKPYTTGEKNESAKQKAETIKSEPGRHTNPNTSYNQGRSSKIRQMIQAGYTIEDIQMITRASKSEIELILKFPETPKPRKYTPAQ